ncbi:MFS transporter [Macrococcus animalis]|uniref:MFS transporter n=1 Tax=Macrococcus animalis TaxID=3395467 RepID=UPI0039BE95F9
MWLGLTISELGGSLMTFSLSLLVYKQSGDVKDIGIMWILYFIPSIIVQLISGPFLDRYSKKKILVYLQIFKGILLVLFIIIYINTNALIVIYIFQIFIGAITPIYTPVSQSILPEISRDEDLALHNSVIDGTSKVMIAISPIVSGLLISYINAYIAIYLAFLCFISSGISLMFLRDFHINPLIKNSWINELKEGFRYYKEQKNVKHLGYLLMSVQFTVGIITVISLPYILKILKGDMSNYGIFMACFPMGYVIGTFAIKWTTKFNQYHVMYMMILIEVIGYLCLGVSQSIYLSYSIELVSGVALSIFNSYNTLLVQKTIKKEIMGRIFSIRLAIIRFSMPLGIVVATLLVDIIGIRSLYLLNSLIISTILLIYIYISRKQNVIINKRQF